MDKTRIRAVLKHTARRLGLQQALGTAPAPSFTDAELIDRTEEFNQAAEAYWQAIRDDSAGRRHVLNKPLSTVQDTPGMFYRLGLVFDALDLGVGMTVLDFGAGGCWLSSSLNRMRCRTIAMDVSPTALQLGRELFAMDPRHHMELDPLFLPYDGHHIGLPDASVERVVMFDAFHHVPNQEEVLAEIVRVLKPGGRAVFGEPGEGHSHTDQSVFEAETTGVLENDLDVADVERKALRAGFTRVLLKPYPNPSLTLSASDYRRLIDGNERLFPMSVLREDLRHFYIFILEKGPALHDSRNPRALKADIQVDRAHLRLTGRASTYVPLRATVRNVGDTLWLHATSPVGGYVMLGGHLFDRERKLVGRGHLRAELPRDVPPGESVEIDARLLMPASPGRYRLRLDMVDEFVAWFEQVGSKAVDLEIEVDGYVDSREPHQLKADIEPPAETLLRAPRPGAPLELALRLHNAGDTRWLHATADGEGAVAVGGHLLAVDGSVLDWDFFRTALACDVDPGAHVDVVCGFAAAPDPGQYRLRIDLVADRRGWFESWGSLPVELRLEVGDGLPDSSAPGRLRAELDAVNVAPLEARPGAPLTLAIDVRNTGNTLWLHAPRPGGGHVSVGGHLRTAAGAMVDLDYVRAALPRDLAPGESARVAIAWQAPSVAGRYTLEFDLVVEGLTWFAARGSKTMSVDLVVTVQEP